MFINLWIAPLLLVAAPPQEEARQVLQVQAAQMVLADGTVVADGVLVIRNGKIARVGRGVELDPSLPLIEHDGLLTAGMVVCQTESGASGELTDATRSILPEARALHAFSPEHSDFKRALRAGITSLVLAPTDDNVVGGVSTVVKSANGTVVKEEAHLTLSFSHNALGRAGSSGFFFFGAAQADGGPENTARSGRGNRYPTSYSGTLQALGKAFDAGEGVFGRAKEGELLLYMHAWDRNEVERAASFARSRKLRGAIRGAPRAGELVELLRESGLGVILGPFSEEQTRPSLESVARLGEAGIPVAFALDAPGHDPESLRLTAAMAVTAGADSVAVWRALTSDAARIAGVEDRVGSLEKGRDADFVLWDGNPLDLTTKVVAVFVDGKRVYGGNQ